MKSARAFSLALFLGSMTLLAQSSGRNDTRSTVADVAPLSTSCPVDLQAHRQPGQGTLAFTADGNKKVAQKIHLIVKNPKFTEIIGLQITVYGFNSKSRVSPAQAASSDSSEIKKVFDLKLKVDPKADASTELLLSEFTSVRSIDLNSVDYAGGSTWHSSTLHSCQIFPDGAMLISHR